MFSSLFVTFTSSINLFEPCAANSLISVWLRAVVLLYQNSVVRLIFERLTCCFLTKGICRLAVKERGKAGLSITLSFFDL